MSTRMTILYPPTIDWHFMKQRPQQILTQFAKHGWRVLYANKTQIKGRPPTIVKPNLEIHHDWEALLRRKPRVDVLWISCAVHKDLDIQAAITVFDSLDDFDAWDPYEPEMLARSDIVFTSSEALYRKQSARHNNVVMLRNACDPEFIRRGKRIDFLRKLWLPPGYQIRKCQTLSSKYFLGGPETTEYSELSSPVSLMFHLL